MVIKMVKQTAGRNGLGDLAPEFARLNDDVLFGEVWSREDKLPLRDRCMITVTALIAKGITDSSLKYHITNARMHGITKTVLLCTDGKGWYQEWGCEARKLMPGDVVYIAPEVKHWHGACADEWFTHIAIEIPADGASNEWLEAVDDDQYNTL